jgi:superfamily II DNA helicase RecQ
MSLPEQKKEGSKWDSLLRKLKENHRKLLSKSCNEIQVQVQSHKSKEIKSSMLNYLNDLKPVLKKSSQLSEEIRSEGNKIYKKSNDPSTNMMDSSFLYTLSLKCSDSSSDLAFAHGNRAAALMRLGFNKVARNDCEEAIKVRSESFNASLFSVYCRF